MNYIQVLWIEQLTPYLGLEIPIHDISPVSNLFLTTLTFQWAGDTAVGSDR